MIDALAKIGLAAIGVVAILLVAGVVLAAILWILYLPFLLVLGIFGQVHLWRAKKASRVQSAPPTFWGRFSKELIQDLKAWWREASSGRPSGRGR